MAFWPGHHDLWAELRCSLLLSPINKHLEKATEGERANNNQKRIDVHVLFLAKK
jgi:hypothetical protein